MPKGLEASWRRRWHCCCRVSSVVVVFLMMRTCACTNPFNPMCRYLVWCKVCLEAARTTWPLKPWPLKHTARCTGTTGWHPAPGPAEAVSSLVWYARFRCLHRATVPVRHRRRVQCKPSTLRAHARTHAASALAIRAVCTAPAQGPCWPGISAVPARLTSRGAPSRRRCCVCYATKVGSRGGGPPFHLGQDGLHWWRCRAEWDERSEPCGWVPHPESGRGPLPLPVGVLWGHRVFEASLFVRRQRCMREG